jgi:hypothetical protein
MTVKVSVTQVREDGSEVPLEEELAAALAGPVQQFSAMLTWTAQQAAPLDHADREKAVAQSGRELQRQVLESSFAVDCAREERAAPLTSAAGIRHGTVEKARERGVVSIFGPVRAGRMAYRNRREANLYPADARWILPDDPYSMGMRALAAYHLAEGGYGQAQEVIAARTGVTVGHAQLAQLAGDLAGWVDEFYDQRAFAADTDLPDSDAPRAPRQRRQAVRCCTSGDQEDGRDRRRRRLHPRRPRTGRHRRPAGPPQGTPRPASPG